MATSPISPLSPRAPVRAGANDVSLFLVDMKGRRRRGQDADQSRSDARPGRTDLQELQGRAARRRGRRLAHPGPGARPRRGADRVRAGRRRRPRAGNGPRLCARPDRVRPPDRLVPGGEAYARRHVCLGDAGALQLLLRRLGAFDQCGGAAGSAAAAARISATQAFQHCAKNNIQVHGGMGFTWEFDCHLYYRRANALALGLGSLS